MLEPRRPALRSARLAGSGSGLDSALLGDSADTQPYAVRREIEDLEAVIDASGSGSAYVYGISSGVGPAL